MAKLHWSQTPEGRKRLSIAIKAAHARRRNGKNGDSGDAKVVPGTLISVEYQTEQGIEKVYLRRKDDPKPAAVMARAAHA